MITKRGRAGLLLSLSSACVTAWLFSACAHDFTAFETGAPAAPPMGSDGATEGSTDAATPPGDSASAQDGAAPDAADCTAAAKCASDSTTCKAACTQTRDTCIANCGNNGCKKNCTMTGDTCTAGCGSTCRTCAGPSCTQSCN